MFPHTIARSTSILLALLCLLPACISLHPEVLATSHTSQQAADVVLFVDTQHPSASDQNSGTQEAPLKTIGAGLREAKAQRTAGRSTLVQIADGIYREQIHSVIGDGSPITLQAITPGKVVISGSDIWDGWQPAGDGSYTHAWPYDWGVEPNPWAGDDIEVSELARRHELVVVDGSLLRQVLAHDQLTEGTFVVDEQHDQITVKPPSGIALEQATVEVGVRERLLQIQRGSNITIRGLVFQHSSEALDDAAVWFIDMDTVLVEDCIFQWNNAVGFKVMSSRNVTIRRVQANNNGIDGLGANRIRGLVLEDTTTAYNNWRGDWGDFYGWAVGQKLLYIHDGIIRRHQSFGNQSRGFWLDTNNSNIVIEASVFRNNRRDGLFIEANNGPITLKESIIAGNGDAGLLIAHSRSVTLEQNILCHNQESQIEVTGTSGTRRIVDWETEQALDVLTEHTTIVQNTMIGTQPEQLLFALKMPDDPWNQLVQTLHADHNRWFHSLNTMVLQVNGARLLNFNDWQHHTGQDTHSVFANPGAIAACQSTTVFLPLVISE